MTHLLYHNIVNNFLLHKEKKHPTPRLREMG